MLKSLLPGKVKVKITIDDVGLKSNLTTNKTVVFTKKSFSFTILGFTESHFGVIDDIPGFVKLIPGSYKSNKPVNIMGIDIIHIKYGCIDGSILYGIRQPILYSFALSSPPGQKTFTEPRIKFFEKMNISVLSHITFYLGDDYHKPVDFNGETSFTYQLIKR